MKKIIFNIACVFSIVCVFSQNKLIDSLESELRLEKDSNKKMILYKDLSAAYIYSNSNISKLYNDSLLVLSKDLENQDMTMAAIYNSAVILRSQGDYEESIKFQKNYIHYVEKQKDSVKLAMSFYQIGASYIRLDRHKEAIENLTKALRYSESIGNDSLSSKILNAIGVIYKQQLQFEKANYYYDKAIKINEKLKDTFALSLIYNGKGVVLLKQDSIDKALSYFQKSLEYGIIVGNEAVMSNQYRNIGTILMDKKEYKKAEQYHLNALEVRKKINQKLTIGGSYFDLGEVYLETGQLQKSESHFNQALVIFKEIKSKSSEYAVYENLAKIFSKKNEYKKANSYLSKYYFIRDSLNKNELRETINEIDIKYQSEKKDKEIAEQELSMEQQELQLQKKQSQYKIMTGLVIFLILVSILTWFLFQQRQKRKNQEIVTLKREQQVRTLETLMEGEEKERLRIAKELHDGVNVDLSAIKYKLTSMLEKNNQVINEVVDMIDKSCEQVRAISHNLVPPTLKDFSLIETIEDFCTTINSIHNTEITFTHIGEAISISKKAEVNIFRIVQELVNNSLKHAEATEINVQLSNHNNNIQLTVEDNGEGFKKEETKSNGIGLQNVQSRVDYLSAKLDFSSNEKGTSYIIDINTEALS